MTTEDNQVYNRYMCMICGFIYDEAEGWPQMVFLPEPAGKTFP